MIEVSRRTLGRLLAGAVALKALPGATEGQKTSSDDDLSWQQVHPGVWRARFGEPEQQTPVRTRLLPPSPASDCMSNVLHPELPVRGVASERGCEIYLPLAAGERVYGFGLQLLSMTARGKKRTMRVNADPRVDTGDSHAPVPFYVTTRGYGILVDTARTVDFYVGNARPRPETPTISGSASVSLPQYTHNVEPNQTGEITVDIPHAHGADLYLFSGPSMLDAVRRYNLFSGGGVAPPEWGLGFWYRADGRADQKLILELAARLRQSKIPCDVLGLEPGWQSHAYPCTFVFDKTRFPQPEELLGALQADSFHVNLWEHAFTHPSSPIFPALVAASGDCGVWEGLVPDFQGAIAREVFGDYHGTHLIDQGVSGFKLDECDGSDFTGGWSFPNCSRFPSGVDGEQMHALFGLRYQHTVLEQFQARNRQTYGLVRSSGALAAPYPFVLYSDLYDHRQFIRGICTSGFCGLLWCPEVRDASSTEDLIRRLQSTVFSPLAMVNAWYIRNEPWKQIDRKLNDSGRFSDDWQELENRCREIIGWRMQLVPYLRSAFNRYAKDGTPPFRALALDYPDAAFADVDDQFLVGDRMMVAPLFAGEPGRDVLLPPGEWHDFWTGRSLQGGTTLHYVSDERNIPVFVKEGSVLPLAPVTPTTADPSSRQLTAHVFGDGSLSWHLHDKDGLLIDAHGTYGGIATGADAYRVVSWKQR